MKYIAVFAVAVLCSLSVSAQVSNFTFKSKVYILDITTSGDGKGYNIQLFGDSSGVLDSARSVVTLLPDMTQEIFTAQFVSVFSDLIFVGAPETDDADETDDEGDDGDENNEDDEDDAGTPGDSAAQGKKVNKRVTDTKGGPDTAGIQQKATELYNVAMRAISKMEIEKERAEYVAMEKEVTETIQKKLEEGLSGKQDTTIEITVNTFINFYETSDPWDRNDACYLRKRHVNDTSKNARVRSVQFSLKDGTVSAFTVFIEPIVLKTVAADSAVLYKICRDTAKAKHDPYRKLIRLKSDSTFHDTCSIDHKWCSNESFAARKGQYIELKKVELTKQKVDTIYGPAISLMRRGDIRLTVFYGKETDSTYTWAKSLQVKDAKGEKHIYYIYLIDILQMSPYDTAQQRTFVLPRDNETANYYLDGENIKEPAPIFVRDRNVNSYFDVAIGTDLFGLFANDNANGKLKTEVSGNFNLFRSNARFNFCQTVHPFLCITNFSREEENVISLNTGTVKSDSVSGLQMMQINNFNGGISLDLLTMRFDGNLTTRLNFKSRHWETPFLYTDTINNTSKNFNVKSRSYEMGFTMSSEVCNGRIKWCYGFALIDFRITNDSIRQEYYNPFALSDLNRKGYVRDFYLPSLFFSNTFEIYYSPKPDSYSKLFCKWNYTYQISRLNQGVSYLQVQVGYTTSISEFVKSLGSKLTTSKTGEDEGGKDETKD